MSRHSTTYAEGGPAICKCYDDVWTHAVAAVAGSGRDSSRVDTRNTCLARSVMWPRVILPGSRVDKHPTAGHRTSIILSSALPHGMKNPPLLPTPPSSTYPTPPLPCSDSDLLALWSALFSSSSITAGGQYTLRSFCWSAALKHP